MACNCSGASRPGFRAEGFQLNPRAAAQAASAQQHEVIDQSGTPTGRRYTNLTAAADHARRINGTTRPV